MGKRHKVGGTPQFGNNRDLDVHSTVSDLSRQTADWTNSKHLFAYSPSASLHISESPVEPYLRIQLGSHGFDNCFVVFCCVCPLPSAAIHHNGFSSRPVVVHQDTTYPVLRSVQIQSRLCTRFRIWWIDWTLSSQARFPRSISEQTGQTWKKEKRRC